MKRTYKVNFTPLQVLMLDRLVERGYFKNRDEALNVGVLSLLKEFKIPLN